MLHCRTPEQAAAWLRGRVRGGVLRTDSRQVVRGDALLAWPGGRTDSRAHVTDALRQGAVACLVEARGVEAFDFGADAPVATLAELRTRRGLVADAYFEHPSDVLDVLAVTGTNGKTSTVWWLAQALSRARPSKSGYCAMVGTLGAGMVDHTPKAAQCSGLEDLLPTGLTTPDAVQLQAHLRRFADMGVRACAIEASSIGIADHRLHGTRLHTGLFTNLTQDHLDWHGSMEAYWSAKRRLFDWPGLRCAVVNVDDPRGAALAAELGDRAIDLWTVSRAGPARLSARDLRDTASGLCFTVREADRSVPVETALLGHYNVSNLLGVMAVLRAHGVPLGEAAAVCASLDPVPGRLQCVLRAGAPLGVIDYAHTPDALEQALGALRPVAAARGGSLWCVFGCGGDRDPTKRLPMGAAASRLAEHVVLTSDNPRNEDPHAILAQIAPALAAHPDVATIAARADAIDYALRRAAPADVVLVAGKGHEDYQEVAGRRLPFSDLAHVRRILAARSAEASA